jgi:hypothetical protein
MPGTAVITSGRKKSRGLGRIDVTVLTDASGDASATVIGEAYGRIVAIYYDGGLDASATVTLKCAGATVYVLTTGTEGTPATFHRPTTIVGSGTGQGTSTAQSSSASANLAIDVHRDLIVGGELSLTVAGGGNEETGKFSLIIDEEFTGGLGIAG